MKVVREGTVNTIEHFLKKAFSKRFFCIVR